MAKVIDAIISLRDNFTAKMEQINNSVTKFQKQAQRLGREITRQGEAIQNFGEKMSAAITLPIVGAGVAATKMAMDAIESENLFEVSMGNMAKAARQWSEQMSKTLGLNAYEVRKNVGTFNVMLTSMGLAEKQAFDMSKTLTKLAYDMASFYNLSPEEAFEKLRSGISGEVEPLKALGIVVNDTLVQAYALSHGLVKTSTDMVKVKQAALQITKTQLELQKTIKKYGATSEQARIKQRELEIAQLKYQEAMKGTKVQLTEQEKVLARYGLIMEATSKAQGDLARTMNSPTNQLRIMKSQLQEVAIKFGMQLIPFLQKGLKIIKPWIDQLSKMNDKQRESVIRLLLYAAAAGPVIKVLGMLHSGVGQAIESYSRFAKTVKITGSVWKAIFTPANTVFLIIVAIAVAAFLIIRYWKPIKSFFTDTFKNVQKAFTDFKANAIDKINKAVDTVKKKFQDFKDILEKNQQAIKTIAAILGTIFGPALIKTGTNAIISGSKIAASFTANIIKSGIQAIISASRITVSFIASMIKAGIQATITGAKITASFIASIIRAGMEAIKTAGIITGRLVLALIQYAAQGWKTVISIGAVTAAWIAQKVQILASAAAMRIATAAQWALNVAMNANPILLVITLVAGLVLGLIALYKHSARTRAVINSLWNSIKNGAISAINIAIELINKLIRAINRIPGINIKTIGKIPAPATPKGYANGTNNAEGGISLVGEKGPELVYLPRGSKVIPNDKTEKILNNRKTGNISVTINMYGTTIREEADIKKLANAIIEDIVKASIAYGGAG